MKKTRPGINNQEKKENVESCQGEKKKTIMYRGTKIHVLLIDGSTIITPKPNDLK